MYTSLFSALSVDDVDDYGGLWYHDLEDLEHFKRPRPISCSVMVMVVITVSYVSGF
jgi:hypothetical protein